MEPTDATELSTLSDDELIDRIRRDNDAFALAELQKRYEPLILKIAGGDREFDEFRDNLQSTLLGCVMDYRGSGVFSAFVKTALHNRAIDFGKDRKKRGHVPPRDGDGALSSHRKLTDDGYSTSDGAPADDGSVSVDDIPSGESESSSAAVLRAAPAGTGATYQWTDEGHAKNGAFVDFWNGVSEGALREAARAKREEEARERSPDPNTGEVVVDESDEAKTERRVSGTEGVARVILERPYYRRLLDLHCYDEDDEKSPREIEQGATEPPVYDDDSKRCPNCLGVIGVKAVYCKHCRRWLSKNDSKEDSEEDRPLDGKTPEGGHNESDCEHCRRWLSKKDRLLDAPEGGHHKSESTNTAALIESATRLVDKTAAERVMVTVEKAFRDRTQGRSTAGRLHPGPANVRAFAVEAVLGPGKAPSPGALRVRKCRARKKAAKVTGAPPSKPPAD